MKYVVICRDEIFYSSKRSLQKCKQYITRTLNKYPNHAELKIYQEVKDENKKK